MIEHCRRPRWSQAPALLLGGLLALALAAPGLAQSTTATIVGEAVDTTGARAPAAHLLLRNVATAAERRTVASKEGTFVFTGLAPGEYVLRASLAGFTDAEIQQIVLNVNDRRSVRIEFTVATQNEGVTVTAETQRLSTSPAVSTVIDRKFVENLPLNGRSLQALLELTPGVVMTRANSDSGQFSVNGQRTSSNYFMIDGVSATTSIPSSSTGFPGQSGAGQLPAMTALGGTNGLVSVDALQEFRIQTSTYAPEFGRTPGGQISMVTRAGTNAYHGSAFDYVRHDAFDANDWFANRNGQPKPKLRQQNFGGVLGGPVLRNRTFFFASYEGLRLQQPKSTELSVPSLEVRATATPAIRTLLDALPLPNGPATNPGFARFSASYSDPSDLDSTSIRIDQSNAGKMTLFGRFHYAPSLTSERTGTLSRIVTTNQNSFGVTAGSTWVISNRLVHDLRVGVDSNDAPYTATPDAFGGAVVPPESVVFFRPGQSPENYLTSVSIVGGGGWGWGTGTNYKQRQFNIVDNLTLTSASHELKAGVDFRRVNPLLAGNGNTGFTTLSFNIADLPLGRVNFVQTYVQASERQSAAFDSLSLYVQDNWRPTARLTLVYGVRWEYVPPPHATEGPSAITLNNLDDPLGGQVTFAPAGTPLWRKHYDNFAPRVGASYVLSDRPGSQFVIRSGFGMFHDLGFGQSAVGFRMYPFAASRTDRTLGGITVPFPLTPDFLTLPVLGADVPQQLAVMDPDLELPFTYQWNVSTERSLGARQSVTVGYVGAKGQDLLRPDRYFILFPQWPTKVQTYVGRNRGRSDYHGLQMQFNRRLTNGIQALASYTLGRSQDTASGDAVTTVPGEKLSPEVDYGDSDMDVRHIFNAAITCQGPTFTGSSFAKRLASSWSMDLLFRARSGFPISMSSIATIPPDTEIVRPNVVPGQPFWIDDANVPGGRYLNRQAFSAPVGTQGNLRRGAVRGFSVQQVDLALRRDVALGQTVRAQFRIEMFNLLNTPSFADPNGQIFAANFGTSTQTLNRGFGGLSSLYQIGGPRSAQFAVKLLF